MKDLVFITSGGRTGTMFLGHNLSRMIDGCFSVHEPDIKHGWSDRRTWHGIAEFGLWHMVVGRALGLTGGLPTAQRYLTGRITHEQAVRRVRAARQRYHSRRTYPLIVESNAQWHPLLPVLRDAFPRAKIVAVTRDRESWVQSWLKRGTRHTDRDPVYPTKRLTPVTLGDAALASQWPSMTAEDRLRWEWDFVNRQIEDFAARDALTRLYRYEDLFVSPDRDAVFADMLEFVSQHGDRRYYTHFDPTLLHERINAT